MKLSTLWIAASALAGVLIMSCGGGDDTGNPGGEGGTVSTGGHAGTAAKGGAAGTGGIAGASGKAGTAGAAGKGGSAGKAGSGGSAGKGGSAGTSGTGGTGGTAGQAGTSGTGGQAGTAGDAGAAGQGGSSGEAGSAGASGTGGAGGSAGAAGTGGDQDAGDDAAPDAGLPDAPVEAGCAQPCDDGLFCNGVETCVNGVCVAGTPPTCNDNIPCTQDFCNSTTDQCGHVANDAPCQNASFCDGHEVCDPLLGCIPGAQVVCNDQVACTNDSCDEVASACKFVADDTNCNDGAFCNGVETCDLVGGCKSGPPPVCDDAIPCTTDACDPQLNACKYLPDDTKCKDSFFCNGLEICSTTQGCIPGAPACTSDNIACTVDCDEVAQACSYTPDNSLCPAGQFCIPALNGCKAGTPCSGDTECNDGKQCNGVETCVNSLCQAGTPMDCADTVACTTDTCDDALGCVHTPKDSVCDDADFCTGVETCSATLGCVSGTPPSCADTIPCTLDLCSTSLGKCIHTPDDTLCTDYKFCNGVEKCDMVQGKCVPGTPVVCPDDGIACTTQECNVQFDKCVTIPDDSLCPCAQTCKVPGGCSNACTQVACAGKVYQCGDCIDNDGDCKVDSKDSQCLGPCDNTENGLWGGIPGQNSAPCKQDCYFDNDSGGGNDHCAWDHSCDPKEQGTPPYPEEKCKWDASLIGSASCPNVQPTVCHDICGPLTPNGCDCFGCCEIPEASNHWIWLGSITYANNNQECTLAEINNPLKCHPCTPVADCLNSCAHCEICIGKPTLPADCQAQQCDAGLIPCGLQGQAPCAPNFYCISGCCQPTLQ
ncbi:MAG: hypothetical protein HY898_25400 [Deltaproteobacteria bacterium]|nr:hypothetical protein [Deltaproteobacteria bacterium]